MAETHSPNGQTAQHGQDRPVTITAADGSSQQIDLKPNAGASIPDQQAIGEESEPLASYYNRLGIDNAKRVQMVKLAHMRYQHPNLDEITTFLLDFGMHVVKRTEDKVWYRGYGPDQYVYYAQKGEKKFLGGAYEVESEAELEKAAKIPGASAIEELLAEAASSHCTTQRVSRSRSCMARNRHRSTTIPRKSSTTTKATTSRVCASSIASRLGLLLCTSWVTMGCV
jgi:hypothetical protein